MLNEIQKMTIRVAVGKAADKDAEIKKLASGFVGTSESEIREYWEGLSGSSSASAEPKNQEPVSASTDDGKHGKRVFWTEDMIRQLVDLREHGETAARIAEMMGLDVKQIKNKLDRLPDRVKVQVQRSKQGEPMKAVGTAPQTPPDEDREAIISLDPVPSLGEKVSAAAVPPTCFIDMPEALRRIVEMVRDDFCGEVTDVHASKGEHRATCTFDYDGVLYEMKLEVLK